MKAHLVSLPQPHQHPHLALTSHAAAAAVHPHPTSAREPPNTSPPSPHATPPSFVLFLFFRCHSPITLRNTNTNTRPARTSPPSSSPLCFCSRCSRASLYLFSGRRITRLRVTLCRPPRRARVSCVRVRTCVSAPIMSWYVCILSLQIRKKAKKTPQECKST